jgi:hypothetical protein
MPATRKKKAPDNAVAGWRLRRVSAAYLSGMATASGYHVSGTEEAVDSQVTKLAVTCNECGAPGTCEVTFEMLQGLNPFNTTSGEARILREHLDGPGLKHESNCPRALEAAAERAVLGRPPRARKRFP